MGAMGALLTGTKGIARWVGEFRLQTNGPFQLILGFSNRCPRVIAFARVATMLHERFDLTKAGREEDFLKASVFASQ